MSKRKPDWSQWERFHEKFTCRIIGHKFTIQKMYGKLCARCSEYKAGR